jgi:hypothetical protein
MSQLSAIRSAVGTALSTIAGLNVHAFHVGSVTPPAVVIMPAPGEFVDYSTAFDPTHDVDIIVGLFVEAGDEESASNEVDEYASATGAKSIYAAIQADPTLGGAVDSAAVLNAHDYGQYEYGGQQYYGCQFTVSVLP